MNERIIRPQPIPSNSKYKYCDFVVPVYETDKISKEELNQICCRTTHCVRLKATTHAENDNLYNVFALHAGQDCDFIRRWLKFFMTTVYPKNFEVAGHHCLMPKGLSLDSWANSIEDGQKGDFLALYGLNLMLDTHTVVHLRNDRLWTTLKDQSLSHNELLRLCNFHLAYLGRGLFVELTKRVQPLTTLEESVDLKTVVLGELIFDEEETLNRVIYHGLGDGIDKSKEQTCSITHTAADDTSGDIFIKKEFEASITQIISENLEQKFNLKKLSVRCNRAKVTQYLESKHQLEKDKSRTVIKCEKTVRIHVHKLNLRTLTSIKLSPDMLRKLHVPVDYDSDKTEDYWPLENSTVFEPIPVNYDSDKTEIYWPLEYPTRSEPLRILKPKKVVKSRKRKIRSKPSKGGFNISVHGVKKRKRRSYLSCKVIGCRTKFISVKAWNAHHRQLHHDIMLKCNLCNKEFKTPSFMRDHTYVHSVKVLNCNLCDRVFAFKSGLQIHRRTHLNARLFKCFAKNCKHEYKWAQDLHRHVQKHLKMLFSCNICDYTTHEKRLIKRHRVRHEDTTYYNCAKCEFKCKYYTQWARHNTKCNFIK